MSMLIFLLAVATVLSIVAVRAAILDGRGPSRPPRSHFEDPQFHPPSAGGRIPEQLPIGGTSERHRGR